MSFFDYFNRTMNEIANIMNRVATVRSQKYFFAEDQNNNKTILAKNGRRPPFFARHQVASHSNCWIMQGCALEKYVQKSHHGTQLQHKLVLIAKKRKN